MLTLMLQARLSDLIKLHPLLRLFLSSEDSLLVWLKVLKPRIAVLEPTFGCYEKKEVLIF